MKFPAALRYLSFALVATVAAAVAFSFLSLVIGPGFESGRPFIERWILRATCDRYTLAGSVRDSSGTPVRFASIEAVYADARMGTRSGTDGGFRLESRTELCTGLADAVTVSINADGFRPETHAIAFDVETLDVVLEPVDF
jgi:hypothetical protein